MQSCETEADFKYTLNNVSEMMYEGKSVRATIELLLSTHALAHHCKCLTSGAYGFFSNLCFLISQASSKAFRHISSYPSLSSISPGLKNTVAINSVVLYLSLNV